MKSTTSQWRTALRSVAGRSLRRSLAALTALAGLWLTQPAPAEAAISAQCGGASWYALDGRRTASGEIMNSNRMTAAHRYLPLGSMVTVHNRRNGRSVTVRINDRGPFVGGRIIDVSRAAAARLGFVGAGVASLCLSRGTAYAANDDRKGSGRTARHRGRGGKQAARSATHRRHVAAAAAKRAARQGRAAPARSAAGVARKADASALRKANGSAVRTYEKDAAGLRKRTSKQVKRNQGGRRSPNAA